MAAAADLSPPVRFDPQPGERVAIAPGLARVTAPNPGPFTYTGTNTYLIGVERLFILDPGPDDSRHLRALERAIEARPVEAILLTHTHRDHAGLARRLQRATGAPLRFSHAHRLFRRPRPWERVQLARACDFALRPDVPIADGETLACDGHELTAIATPGHCENHLAFGLAGTSVLFSGDHVMGWSSTVIAPPDGAMGPYLHSLQRLMALPFDQYHPGHGGPIAQGREATQALLSHRQERNGQILAGLAAGADTPGKLVTRLYPEISPVLRWAARQTVQAHLDYLVQTGAATPGHRLGRPHYRLGGR